MLSIISLVIDLLNEMNFFVVEGLSVVSCVTRVLATMFLMNKVVVEGSLMLSRTIDALAMVGEVGALGVSWLVGIVVLLLPVLARARLLLASVAMLPMLLMTLISRLLMLAVIVVVHWFINPATFLCMSFLLSKSHL